MNINSSTEISASLASTWPLPAEVLWMLVGVEKSADVLQHDAQVVQLPNASGIISVSARNIRLVEDDETADISMVLVWD